MDASPIKAIDAMHP